MAKKISVAVIISTYNWPKALQLVLDSIAGQTMQPDEVIIADDGSDKETEDLINFYRQQLVIPLRHCWHQDKGFQKTIILNEAIADTNCDYIIQIDGDIILEKHFIQDHVAEAERGFFVSGSRVLFSESKTTRLQSNNSMKNISFFSNNISNRFNSIRLPFLKIFFTRNQQRSDDFRGCNCAFWREDFIQVNGYNHNLTGWGHEDIELAARFIHLGLTQKKLKMVAVCYHLYHPLADRINENINFKKYQETVKSGVSFCTSGYTKVIKNKPVLLSKVPN
jgi:glycosyltransferase involved in cell wall biosynthesis